MPEAVADPSALRCYSAASKNGNEGFQWVDPDLFCPPRAGARRWPATGRWTPAWASQQAGQHLLGQQHEGLVAERRAEEIVEPDLLVQAQDVVEDLVRRAVQDHLVEIAPDRIDAGQREAPLHDRPMLRAEIGIQDPFGAAPGDVSRFVG